MHMADDLDAVHTERLHVPTPQYPADYRPHADEVWTSAPTTFHRAALAWCASAETVAHPIYPSELRHMVETRIWSGAEPNFCDLSDLDAEATRRTDWGYGGGHCVTPRCGLLWQHRAQFGLLWESSVQTILARTAPGWVVRIVGWHQERREAAEFVLGPHPMRRGR